MSAPENPRAFPRANEYQYGMTLRDYFAGQALAGLCSQHDATGMWSWLPNDAVVVAYKIADAMLAERAKGGAA